MSTPHCWTGRNCPKNLAAENVECFGCEHPDCFYGRVVEAADGTCMLEAGHDGPHEWTSDDEIGIDFLMLSLPDEDESARKAREGGR